MDRINAFEFALTIQKTCDRSAIVVSFHTQIFDNTIVKMRVMLVFGTFVDVFYNSKTGKCSYALIKDSTRLFGADNAFIGWHIHPFENPSEHLTAGEMPFDSFLHYIENQYSER